jgi:hypothetical protein
MSPDREHRHATAAELEADIEGLLEELGDRVTSREAGRVVSRLFADVRDSTRMMIEQQLSASASMTWTGRRVAGTIPLTPVDPVSQRLYLQDVIPSIEPSSSSPSTAPTLSPPPVTRLDWKVWTLASVAILLLLFLVLQGVPRETPSSGSTAVSPGAVAPAAAPAPVPALATLSVQADPPEATLFLDNEKLPSNPYTGKLALDKTEHVVRAEAPGYTASSRRFLMNDDLQLEFKLDRAKPEIAPVGRRRAAPAPAAPAVRRSSAPATGATANGPNCDTPFFIDARGIKRVLPECL